MNTRLAQYLYLPYCRSVVIIVHLIKGVPSYNHRAWERNCCRASSTADETLICAKIANALTDPTLIATIADSRGRPQKLDNCRHNMGRKTFSYANFRRRRAVWRKNLMNNSSTRAGRLSESAASDKPTQAKHILENDSTMVVFDWAISVEHL